MARLVIGNSLDGNHPALGSLSEFRFGGDNLRADYETFDASEFGGSSSGVSVEADFEASGAGTKSWLGSYMSREGDSRMTGFADIFVPLVESHAGKWYSRIQVNSYSPAPENYRSYGLSGVTGGEVGISLRLTRDSELGNVWFDNASMLVSGILWEVNSSGGDGVWYPLYVIPGHKPVRVNLPDSSDRIRFRAISCDPSEWLQSISADAILDYGKHQAS